MTKKEEDIEKFAENNFKKLSLLLTNKLNYKTC